MTHHRTFRAATALAAALALALTGCASDSDEPAEPADPAADTDSDTDTETGGETAAEFPVTVDTAAGELVIEEQPQRIVSLSPSATELLFAIGAGDQVIAADEWSTYPEEAPTTDLSGYEPNIEAIVAYEPDLVVISNDLNDVMASLQELDIPVLLSPAPADVESGYDEIAALGLATGQVEGTAEVVAQMRAGMDEAMAAAPEAELRIYHELDEAFFAASSHSFIGSVYEQMGAVNIADEADTDQTGYPQLTEEAIVEANPQLIVITDEIGYTPEDVAARPGWSEIDAVKNDNIVVVDSDVASRWGPRLPELVQLVADAMSEAAVPAGR